MHYMQADERRHIDSDRPCFTEALHKLLFCSQFRPKRNGQTKSLVPEPDDQFVDAVLVRIASHAGDIFVPKIRTVRVRFAARTHPNGLETDPVPNVAGHGPGWVHLLHISSENLDPFGPAARMRGQP